MKRSEALDLIRFAAFHGDDKAAFRAYTENRISLERFKEALDSGRKAMRDGMTCGCCKCSVKGAV